MITVNVSTAGKTTVVQDTDTNVVYATTAGPQGPSAGIVVDADAKVDKSVIYYDASAARFKADPVWTTSTLADGGNF
jgi:hypothetical protein